MTTDRISATAPTAVSTAPTRFTEASLARNRAMSAISSGVA
jgi:hypothetical protein